MSTLVPENIEDLVTEYNRLWQLMPKLHRNIARRADKNTLKACAKRLGVASKNGKKLGMSFETEYETDLFQDYLIYMYRPRGFSLVRKMRNRKPYPEGSDEQQLLENMQHARFSLFWIKELHQGSGIVVLDVISGEELFVLDQTLPQQDVTGLLAAFRIFPFGEVWMHTGASMAFGVIKDPKDLKPTNRKLNEKEEQQLNEENFSRWRAFIRAQS